MEQSNPCQHELSTRAPTTFTAFVSIKSLKSFSLHQSAENEPSSVFLVRLASAAKSSWRLLLCVTDHWVISLCYNKDGFLLTTAWKCATIGCLKYSERRTTLFEVETFDNTSDLQYLRHKILFVLINLGTVFKYLFYTDTIWKSETGRQAKIMLIWVFADNSNTL